MKRQWTVTDTLLTGLMLLIVGGFLMMHWGVFQQWQNYQRLDAEGVTGTATILDLNLTGSVRSVTQCRVEYQYQFEGQQFSDEQVVDAALCTNRIIGDEVSILLLPDQPDRSNLGIWSQTPIQLRFFLLLLIDGVIIFGSIGFWLNQRLTEKGQLENAERLKQFDKEGLSLTVHRPKGEAVMDWGCVLPFGLLVTIGLLAAMVLFVQQGAEQGWGLAVVGICSALPFLAFGLVLLNIFFKDTAVSYTFTKSDLKIKYRLGQKEVPLAQIKSATSASRPTKSGQYHFVKLTLADEKTLEINVPEQNIEQLIEKIQTVYLNPSTS